MIDEDTIQRIKVAGIFLLQIYKVTTGTLLSLFVPQSCGNKICTVQENYDNSDGYHKTVLYWNMFSMFTFFTYYMIELRREEWAIKYLDIDNDKPDNSLKHIIVKEPTLDKKMDKLNLFYYRSLMVNCGVYGINILLTIKLIKDGYHSSSTLSCFLSFTLLVLMKLYNSVEVAHQSVKNDKMMSAYMSEFISFNVLDADYVKDKKDKEDKENTEKESKEMMDQRLEKEQLIPVKVSLSLEPCVSLQLDEIHCDVDGQTNDPIEAGSDRSVRGVKDDKGDKGDKDDKDDKVPRLLEKSVSFKDH